MVSKLSRNVAGKNDHYDPDYLAEGFAVWRRGCSRWPTSIKLVIDKCLFRIAFSGLPTNSLFGCQIQWCAWRSLINFIKVLVPGRICRDKTFFINLREVFHGIEVGNNKYDQRNNVPLSGKRLNVRWHSLPKLNLHTKNLEENLYFVRLGLFLYQLKLLFMRPPLSRE